MIKRLLPAGRIIACHLYVCLYKKVASLAETLTGKPHWRENEADENQLPSFIHQYLGLFFNHQLERLLYIQILRFLSWQGCYHASLGT